MARWRPSTSLIPLAAQGGTWQVLFRDPILRGALIISLAIAAYQMLVMLFRPSWLGMATDWMRAGLAWIETIPVMLAAIALSQSRRPGALAWWMFSAAMGMYSFAQTAWAVIDQIITHGHAPVPSLADLGYLLQYPFFFAALALLPGASRQGQPAITRVKVVLDSLLLMAAGTALSWYFILAPFYLQSSQSVLGKAVNLAYPVGDLGLLFGLAVVGTRQGARDTGRIALRILITAIIFLIIADSWFLYLELYSTNHAGDPPDGFWIVCYLLFALAGLAQFRAAQHEQHSLRLVGASQGESSESRPARDVVGNFRLLVPFVAAVVSSVLIVFHAVTSPIGTENLLIPFGISLGLIGLVMARQGITVLENGRLLRDEQQQKEELALAKQIAEDQRQLLAERNQRLERDIEALKELLARVARGDHSARARLESGELLPIAGSLNLMLDRFSHLVRSHAGYTRIEQALPVIVEAAQGLAAGDERALSKLSAPTNTPLDGVAIALGQLRGRLRELSIGLRRLDLARKAAREFADLSVQQGQFITNESAALSGLASVLTRLAAELERAAHLLEEHATAAAPANRQVMQTADLLRMLARASRRQVAEIEAQVTRFVKAEERANQIAINGRRLIAELDAAARVGGSKLTMDMPEAPAARPEARPATPDAASFNLKAGTVGHQAAAPATSQAGDQAAPTAPPGAPASPPDVEARETKS